MIVMGCAHLVVLQRSAMLHTDTKRGSLAVPLLKYLLTHWPCTYAAASLPSLSLQQHCYIAVNTGHCRRTVCKSSGRTCSMVAVFPQSPSSHCSPAAFPFAV